MKLPVAHDPDDDGAARVLIVDQLFAEDDNETVWSLLTAEPYVLQTDRILRQVDCEALEQLALGKSAALSVRGKLRSKEISKRQALLLEEGQTTLTAQANMIRQRCNRRRVQLEPALKKLRSQERDTALALERKALLDTVIILARAVSDHRRCVEGEHEPENHDRLLWARLSALSIPCVRAAGGLITLEDLLRQVGAEGSAVRSTRIRP
ncbi:hypothetical protein LFM09_41115 [Lentzea alba]|uniref:hypothetical protein n=1 Tax=Lentzea alba TaxID=2714351 RepID=UPI0039BF09BC